MLSLSQIYADTKTSCSLGDNCVKTANIKCHWNIALCGNFSQCILLYGPDKVSIKCQTGPMTVFYTFTEGYINQEHTGLLCTMFRNFITGGSS